MADEDDKVLLPVRLAFRAEGEWVNCYIALTDTMENARLVASVARAYLDADPELFELYKQSAGRMMDAFLKAAGLPGAVSHEEQPAPEHERSGHG